ncbi:2Fe-2S iron-sulfur cluster-binding protein [Streptomyces sp. NPDC007076]|uniref:(2Fe-2S)-binding protein n=1 Tax=Streptomyces sp. NPDC007076 TaxID=3160975 RepID=UPI0033D862A3
MSNEDHNEQHGQQEHLRHGSWEPTPQGGEYDDGATAFVHLPPEDLANIPLAAPGQGYVPPMILPLTPAAGLDPSATGSWVMQTQNQQDRGAGAEQPPPEAVHWPDPNQQQGPYDYDYEYPRSSGAPQAPHDPYAREQYRETPAATGQWNFTESPEFGVHTGQTDYTGQTTHHTGQTTHHTGQTDYAGEADYARHPGLGDHAGHTGQVDQTGQVDYSGQVGHTGQVDLTGHGDHTGQVDLTGHGDHTGQVDLTGHGDHTGHVDLTGHSGHTGHVDLTGHGGHTGQVDLTGHGDHTGQIGHVDPADHTSHDSHTNHDSHGGHTGQWTIPVADGDLPEESGEFAASALAAQWYGDRTPPATLPGGAPAPWATQQPTPEPEAELHAGPEPELVAEPAPLADIEPEHAPGAEFERAPESAPAPAATAEAEPVEDRSVTASVTAPVTAPGADLAPETAPDTASGTAPDIAVSDAPVEHPVEPAPEPEQYPAVQAQAPAQTPPADEPHDVAAEAGQLPSADPAPAAVPDTPPAPPLEAHTPDGTEPQEPQPTDSGETDSGPVEAGQPESGQPEPGQADAQPADFQPAEPQLLESEPLESSPLESSPLGVPDEHPAASYVLHVNGADRPVTDAWIGESLLYVLRERLGLAGAKDGCSQGECGACNVQVDGRLVASCLVPAATAAGSEVRTVEGLAVDGEPSDVQRALAKCGAVQCGFCIPGMAMTVHDLLEGNHAPSELETRQALCGNLCRCSGYRGVLDAVNEVIAGREATLDPASSDSTSPEPDEARIPHQAAPGAGSVQQPHPQDGGMA